MMKLPAWLRSTGCALALLAGTALMPAPAAAQAPSKITIVVFGFPSLGAFMPPVIKAKHFDTAHGLDIDFVERPPDAYTTQFNSGEFKVGGSAAVLTVGLAEERGVKVKYLFNLFDFWGTVVTSRPGIKTLKDIEGKELAAASSTTNFVMSEFFAKQQGVDISKIQVINTAPPGLVGYALADQARRGGVDHLNFRDIDALLLGEEFRHHEISGRRGGSELLAFNILERLDLGPRGDDGAPVVKQIEQIFHLHAARVGKSDGQHRGATADLELAGIELRGVGIRRPFDEFDIEAMRLVELFGLDHRRHEGAERGKAEHHDGDFLRCLRGSGRGT